MVLLLSLSWWCHIRRILYITQKHSFLLLMSCSSSLDVSPEREGETLRSAVFPAKFSVWKPAWMSWLSLLLSQLLRTTGSPSKCICSAILCHHRFLFLVIIIRLSFPGRHHPLSFLHFVYSSPGFSLKESSSRRDESRCPEGRDTRIDSSLSISRTFSHCRHGMQSSRRMLSLQGV